MLQHAHDIDRDDTLRVTSFSGLSGDTGGIEFKPNVPLPGGGFTDQLVITPNAQSKIKGKISIDDTDYKEILGAEYERYKNRKRKAVMTQRQSQV